MASKRITQVEARRMKCRLEYLERQIRAMRGDYSQWRGAEVFRGKWDAVLPIVRTANRCGHGVAVVCTLDGELVFKALPHPEESVL